LLPSGKKVVSPLRVVYFGTPDYALPTLDRLLAGPHDVVAVVSQPDRRRGRGRALRPSPVAERALDRRLPLLRPERVGSPEAKHWLLEHAPELGVVVAFGQFLPRQIRELPTRGYLINAHASLLPRHRGAAPIQRAILAGDSETGVSVMRVEREMDAGPVARVLRTPIEASTDGGELTARLARLSAQIIAESLEAITAGKLDWSPQDPSAATYAPKLGAEEFLIDWRQSAQAIARQVRALAPAPGAHTLHAGERLRVLVARSEPEPAPGPPGCVHIANRQPLRVATGEGWLLPKVVQRPGGKAMPIDAYLRGRPMQADSVLGKPAG